MLARATAAPSGRTPGGWLAFAARLLALCLAGLAAVVPASAQEHDPFALLFGDEPERLTTGTGDRLGEDDFTLVGLRLNALALAADLPAWEVRGGVCLDPASVFAALEFPITETAPGVFSGWFIAPGRTLTLDMHAATASVSGSPVSLPEGASRPTGSEGEPDAGFCLTPAGLTAILPLKARWDPGFLRVTLEPREVLPIEARLEREARRAEMLARPDPGRADFPELPNPYRFLSWPSADLSLDLSAAPDGTRLGVSLESAFDLAWTTARLRSITTSTGDENGLALTLSRDSLTPDAIGPLPAGLGARSFALGDIGVGAVPLIARASSGRGVVISSRPVVSADVFDAVTLRGPLPAGWEAELYSGESLLAWVTQPDPQGDWVFEDVSLVTGYNTFRVELFGPNGERDTVPITRFVGAELQPENEVYYTLAMIEEGRGVFDAAREVSEPAQAPSATLFQPLSNPSLTPTGPTSNPSPDGGLSAGPEASGARFLFSAEAGLSPTATVRFDAVSPTGHDPANPPRAALSVAATHDGHYGILRLATDADGAAAMEAAWQKRLGPRTSMSLIYNDFLDMQGEVNGRGEGRLVRELAASLDTVWATPTRARPVRLAFALQETAAGGQRLGLSTRVSDTFGPVRLTHASQTQRVSAPGSDPYLSHEGQWLAGASWKGLRLRGVLNYGFNEINGLEARSLAFAASGKAGRDTRFELAVSRDMVEGPFGLEASLSRPFGPGSLSLGASGTSAGDWRAGVSLSLGLSRDASVRRYSLDAPGVTRSGTLRPFVFDDVDQDGVFGPGDAPLEGAKFVLDQALRSAQTASDGRAVLDGVQPVRPLALEVQSASLPDPLMRPASPGVTVRTRPGQSISLPVPVVLTAEAEVMVALVRDGRRIPLGGVVVEVVNAAGEVVASAVSEYDGYVYIDAIPMGTHTLRAGGGRASSTPQFTVSRDNPTAGSLSLSVFPAARDAWPA